MTTVDFFKIFLAPIRKEMDVKVLNFKRRHAAPAFPAAVTAPGGGDAAALAVRAPGAGAPAGGGASPNARARKSNVRADEETTGGFDQIDLCKKTFKFGNKAFGCTLA